MVSILIDINDEEKERILIDFLTIHKYEYGIQTTNDVSAYQQDELRRREIAYQSGSISTIPWDDAKKLFIRNR